MLCSVVMVESLMQYCQKHNSVVNVCVRIMWSLYTCFWLFDCVLHAFSVVALYSTMSWWQLLYFEMQIGDGSINSTPPIAAYMRKWSESALVQIMACRLFSPKPLSKPMLGYYQLDRNKLQWNFHQNASENIVCEMPAILSRGRWVNIC